MANTPQEGTGMKLSEIEVGKEYAYGTDRQSGSLYGVYGDRVTVTAVGVHYRVTPPGMFRSQLSDKPIGVEVRWEDDKRSGIDCVSARKILMPWDEYEVEKAAAKKKRLDDAKRRNAARNEAEALTDRLVATQDWETPPPNLFGVGKDGTITMAFTPATLEAVVDALKRGATT
jgi:hypothetical protein